MNITAKFITGIGGILVAVLTTEFFIFNLLVNKREEAAFVDRFRKVAFIAKKTTLWLANHEADEAKDKSELDPHSIQPLISLIIAQASAQEHDYDVKLVIPSSHDPDNAPDDFGKEALSAFENDPSRTEYYKRQTIEGQQLVRLAVPIKAEKACLVCHEQLVGPVTQVAKDGKLLAAFQITAPADELIKNQTFNTILSLTIVFLTLCFIGIGIYVMTNRIIKRPLSELTAIMEAVTEDPSMSRRTSIDAVAQKATERAGQPPQAV
ncbi:MAG: DUF3365 domain-containing protein [Candidatus Zixiibacteriota bacterium]